ncbi:MAG: GNAT family N-acetyltransferase [Thermomicrobia bacterium]|nr:GNAT family N-acetyltransferase [Thermomicrobia bacterium]
MTQVATVRGAGNLHIETTSVDALRDAWDALVPAAITPFPFQSTGWAAAWCSVFAEDAEPLVLAVRDDAGALIGIAPLVLRQTALGRTVQLIGGDDLTDYLDIIAADQLDSAADAPSATLRILTARDEALAALPDFFRLHRLSAPDKERFLTAAVEQFFRGMTGAMADAGWLRLYFLDVEGAPVAAMFTFVADGRLLVYNSGFDPAYARISVGMVLTGRVIEDAANGGLTLCDFLRGNEAYKYRFGASDTPIWRVIAARDRDAVDRTVAETEARFHTAADSRDLTDAERAAAMEDES